MPSLVTMATMAIVVGMVGSYVTSAVGVLCVLAGGLIMMWINHALLIRVDDAEACLRGVLDTATDALITIDSTSLIQSFNPRAEAMFGYPAAEVLGHNLRTLWSERLHPISLHRRPREANGYAVLPAFEAG